VTTSPRTHQFDVECLVLGGRWKMSEGWFFASTGLLSWIQGNESRGQRFAWWE
jgi:hypothetical protein